MLVGTEQTVMQKNAGCWKDTEYRIKAGNVSKDVISFRLVCLGSALKKQEILMHRVSSKCYLILHLGTTNRCSQ